MGDFTRTDWSRQKGESNLWYGRFLVYRNMGSERTALSAYRLNLKHHGQYQKAEKATFVGGGWQKAMGRYNWTERAEAWDAEERRSKESRRKRYVEEIDSEAHEIAVEAMKKARKMIEWPLAQTTVELDGKTHILVPAGWNQNTAIRWLKEAHTVGLAALGIVRTGAVGVAQALKSVEKQVAEDDPISDMEWLKSFLTEEVEETSNGEGS